MIRLRSHLSLSKVLLAVVAVRVGVWSRGGSPSTRPRTRRILSLALTLTHRVGTRVAMMLRASPIMVRSAHSHHFRAHLVREDSCARSAAPGVSQQIHRRTTNATNVSLVPSPTKRATTCAPRAQWGRMSRPKEHRCAMRAPLATSLRRKEVRRAVRAAATHSALQP